VTPAHSGILLCRTDRADAYFLPKFSWFKIRRHVMVKGASFPDDAHLREYWAKRSAAKSHDLSPSKRKLAHIQNHVCPLCGESIHNGEEIHAHHIDGRKYDDVILVHLYCHQQAHRPTGKNDARQTA